MEKTRRGTCVTWKKTKLTHLKKVISEEIKQVKAEIRDFNDSAKDLDHLRAKHDQGIESMENEIESLKNKLAEAKLQREQQKKVNIKAVNRNFIVLRGFMNRELLRKVYYQNKFLTLNNHLIRLI